MQYEKSIQLLNEIICDKQSSHYEKYYAYLLESYTYKRLFNYTKTLHKLDLALAEGLQSDQKEEVQNTILAEKCFVYFDTQDFTKAEDLTIQLQKAKFKHISETSKSWIIMQDGYMKMLNNNFEKSEELLDEAIALVKVNSPENLPNIYGKKMELYNKMGLIKERDNSFKIGLSIAKKYKKVKYELYLYQVMRNIFQENEEYKNAFFTQKKYDSLFRYYNVVDANSKLELAEKKLEDQNRKLIEQNKKYFDYILYGVVASLVLLLFFAIRLYQSNKSKRILVEKENTRIYAEIEQLSISLDQKGKSNIDFSILTDRQREIIDYIREGLTNKEIACKMFISENTVKYHLKVIYDILKVENRSAIR